MKASITLIPRLAKDTMRKLQINIPYWYKHKILQDNTTKLNSATYRKGYILWSNRCIPEIQGLFYMNIINVCIILKE
jgi:hypothetical protein